MFCPKCGTNNPEDGKFCRSCGTNLSGVSEAIKGKVPVSLKYNKDEHKKRKSDWESAIVKLFTGSAFLIISIILSLSTIGIGWWFWMLIPAFSMIGAGIAKIIQLKEYVKYVPNDLTDDMEQVSSKKQNALPPDQSEYVSNIPDVQYETGDLVPPSVVENTTRHLQINKEGETMTLPPDRI